MVTDLTTRKLVFSDLVLFVTAVELGGLAAAARRLGIQKASASRQLQRLERMLGCHLVHRSGKRFSLSEEGRTLLPHATRAIQEIDEAVGSLRTKGGMLSGPFRIAAPYHYGRTVIGPLLPRFMKLHPELEITLHLGSRAVDLMRDEADLAIRVGAPGSPELIVRKIGDDTIILCASPPYLAASAPIENPADLAAHPLLDFRVGSGARDLDLIGPTGEHRIRAKPMLQSNEPSILIEAALQGAGVVIAPMTFAKLHLENGELERVLPDWTDAPRDINAIYAPGRGRSAKVRAFLDFLVRALA